MPFQNANNRAKTRWEQRCGLKIISPSTIGATADALRQSGKTIATINGSFDLLHAGHLHILYEASRQAEILIVALNSDHSIKQYKSVHRPIIDLANRLQMMAALGFVDYVTWFDETDPRALLSLIRPDVHVNGAEYGKDCIEAETVSRFGGRLHLVERIPGLATSEIINKIQQLCDCSEPSKTKKPATNFANT